MADGPQFLNANDKVRNCFVTTLCPLLSVACPRSKPI